MDLLLCVFVYENCGYSRFHHFNPLLLIKKFSELNVIEIQKKAHTNLNVFKYFTSEKVFSSFSNLLAAMTRCKTSIYSFSLSTSLSRMLVLLTLIIQILSNKFAKVKFFGISTFSLQIFSKITIFSQWILNLCVELCYKCVVSKELKLD